MKSILKKPLIRRKTEAVVIQRAKKDPKVNHLLKSKAEQRLPALQMVRENDDPPERGREEEGGE